jgi:hypothetical protein
MKLTICGNEFVFIAMGVFSSFRRHNYFKDKFQESLSLEYKHPKRGHVFTFRSLVSCALLCEQTHTVYRAYFRSMDSDLHTMTSRGEINNIQIMQE